jgi:hypothetical protein
VQSASTYSKHLVLKVMRFIRSSYLLIILAIMVLASGVSRGQEEIKSGTGREELNRGTTHQSKPTVIYGTKTRIVYRTTNARPTVTTGTLSVATLPNSAIRVEPVKGGEALEGVVPVNERLFIFSSLKPGAYRVAAALNGHKSAEQRVQILANKNKGVTLELEQILYTVRIMTNVNSGEVRYANVEAYTEGGEKKYRRVGVTQVVPIDSGTAVLTGLAQGNYGLDIGASGADYDNRYTVITLPDETNKNEITLEITLKNVRSTEDFSGLTADQWDLPPGWNIAKYLLTANGKGIAIPRQEKYRHYTDFQLISTVRMLNGVGASFVLRASLPNDYYLIQLNGENASEPYVLKGYRVRNGVREPLQSVPISHLKDTIKQNQDFTVSLKMKDNNIEVSVADSQTGDYYPLGIISDTNRKFIPIGAVGIYVDNNEQNRFGRFIVCNNACPKD